ncbi:SusC/RagA family TonB-linked outer membrane protein [Flavobacterium agrisoli]|uniref:SusC/RagA family TonB-linked outer membrane protein n=1 Tax=Flavobacterium agrisoli TaxID=2793066 RepID=A0A934UI72_9FLAO|nr:SusC/RagA family TonB-linked outer membrane protein [Flavobacterium agrisoli]MBK0368309.1 SusC/RagA family TonB-linked outer membrane protein [Flavobacterium agrisoli]
MRSFIFLFCSTLFGFTPIKLFSQNTKVTILADKVVSVDEVFDIIHQQTDYTFIYQEDLFKNLPKVHLKKGKIKVSDLLEASFPKKGFNFSFANGNTIVVKEIKEQKVTTVQQDLIKITGLVTDSQNEPIPGVNIIVKETKVMAQTDFDGKYAIIAPVNGTLLCTYIGYKNSIVDVNNRKVINFKLAQETNELKGVTVNTGVTVRKKELITGAVTTFKGEELRQVSTQNVVQALKSLDPSFIVVNNNITGSNPNTLPTIEVRGQTSLNASQLDSQFKEDPNQPLFILDGFPTTLQQVVDLDINRIASITILKDAASTALYGSRSANGVVVIETTAPVAGNLQFSYVYNSAYEVADLSVYHLMNAEQKLEFERLSGAYIAPVGYPDYTQLAYNNLYNERLAAVRRGVDTYWLSEPLQVGITSGHSMSLGGGKEAFRFNITGNYKTLSGTMKGSEHNTWGYNTTLTYRKNKLNFTNNFFVSGGDNQESPYGTFDIYANASPYYPKYNENGVATLYLDGRNVPLTSRDIVLNNPTNPLYNVSLPSFNKSNVFNFTNNFGINYDVNKHIKATGAISVSRNTTDTDIFVSPDNTAYVNTIATEKGSYTQQEKTVKKWNANIGATYSSVFNNVHSLNYTIRASALETTNNFFSSILRGFPSGVPGNPAFAFGFQADSKPGTSNQLIRNVDLTNQVNYAYDRKYLFDFTQTISGSTNFGSNQKYSPYWGVGLGWNLNNEFKMNEDIVNIFKLRANYGETGNQNLVGYASYDVYAYDADTNVFGTGLNVSQVANPDLEPQKTKDLSLGLDLGMFRNRLTMTLGAYQRKTSPQIVAIDLASSTGLTSYPMNVGYLTTKGLELKINYNIIYNPKEDIIWGVGLLSSTGKNELGGFNNTLASLNEAAQNTTSLTRYYDGASTNDLWAVPSLGIDPATGREVFLKKNGQTTFELVKSDEVVMGNSREIATGVISTNLNYKGFSFSVYMRYSFGGDQFNSALYNKVENISRSNIFNNQDVRALTDRWTTPGQVAQFKAISVTEKTPISSRFIQKNDYISGESMRFGYRITDKAWLKKSGLVGLSFNAIANDFFRVATIKAERGTDYPFSRIFSLNINVSF